MFLFLTDATALDNMLEIVHIESMRRYLFGVFLTLLLSLAVTSSASAQALSQRWMCLDAHYCSDDSAGCAGVGNRWHRARLTTKEGAEALPNSDTYVVECFTVNNQVLCTTGNEAGDTKVFGASNLTKLNSAINYQFEGMFKSDGQTAAPNPTKADATGKIGSVEWQSFSKYTARKFLAVNFFSGENAQPGSAGGQQQGTLEFEVAKSDCVAINWDPFGRVFDAQTLEPIKGAVVTLMMKNGSSYKTATNADFGGFSAITNPQNTKADGLFEFVVPDNTYKLQVSAPGYTFPLTSLSSLNSGYSRIYKDIYPAQTGEDIVQKGKIQHRDIPLVATGAHQDNPVELVEYFTTLDKVTGEYVVEGRVSHPFAKVNVWTDKEGYGTAANPHFRIAATAKADVEGKFQVRVDQSAFEQGETVSQIEVVKQPLTTGSMSWIDRIMGIFVKDANAQDNRANAAIEPIPNYLEGVAYDRNNNPIPNAQVSVYVEGSKVPYHSVVADETGKFVISSEYLPFLPYTLEYTSANGTTTAVSTSTYMTQNAEYHKTNNVDSNVLKLKNGTIVRETPGGDVGMKKGDSNTSMMKSSPQYAFIVTIMLIIMLIVIAVILVLFVKNKNKDKTMMPPSGDNMS